MYADRLALAGRPAQRRSKLTGRFAAACELSLAGLLLQGGCYDRLEKILVPTDFSDLSQEALEFALALAEKFRAKLYVCTFGSFPYGDYQGRGRPGRGFDCARFAPPERDQTWVRLLKKSYDLRRARCSL